MSVNRELSEQVAQAIKAKVGQCYANAAFALLHSDQATFASLHSREGNPLCEARYVEGVVVCDDDGKPIDHGWLELDGEVIDPTLTVYVTKKIRLPNKHQAKKVREEQLRALEVGRHDRYIPDTYYTRVEMCKRIAKGVGLPFDGRFGPNEGVRLEKMRDPGRDDDAGRRSSVPGAVGDAATTTVVLTIRCSTAPRCVRTPQRAADD